MSKLIDISEHNGTIDFEKVKKSGIDTVILRIGWIGNKENHTLDKKFNEYYKQARLHGFKIGYYVYSYCLSKKAIESGMRWTEKQICNKQVDLPIFLDMEDASLYRCTNNELTEHIVTFCKFFKSEGYKSGVYASLFWFKNKFTWSKIKDFEIWLAEWNNKTSHSFKEKVNIWQYSADGKVNGIKTKVDMNVSYYKEKKEDDVFVDMKEYKNGSTPERVYADSACSMLVGKLNPYEKCDCLGIFNEKYLIKYKIDGTQFTKVGFVKYNGGVK